MSDVNNAQTVARLAQSINMNLKNPKAPSLITIPESYVLKNTEASQEHRDRFRGTFKTKSLQAFSDYLNERGSADKCFVDNNHINQMACQAIFNLGNEAVAGHADDTANLVLSITHEFASLRNSQRLTQKGIIEFVQDYAYCLSFHESVDGEVGEKMSLATAINAFRNVTIKTARAVVSDVRDMSSTKSALENIEASSGVQLPGFIVMKAPAYDDLPTVDITARLSVLTDDENVRFGVRIVGEHKLLNEQAKQFVEMIKAAVPDDLPVYAGTFAP